MESWLIMKPKKMIIDIFIIIIIAFTLFTLWYNNDRKSEPTKTVSVNQDYKIYLITKDNQYQFWRYMNDGASDMANLLGLSYLWDAPTTEDTAKQIQILNNAVKNGADAVVIAANDIYELAEPIRNAKSAGVKIIYVDTPTVEDGIITLATNNYTAGKIAAENMLFELDYSGIHQGEIGIVGLNTEVETTMQREKSFRQTIEADGRFTLLDTIYKEGDPIASQVATTKLINEHKDLVGLFSTNEGSTEGIGNSIKEDNNKIIGIGFDRSDENIKLLREDSLKVIIDQNPYTMGYFGVAEAFAALKGYDTGPSYIDTGVAVLRKR